MAGTKDLAMRLFAINRLARARQQDGASLVIVLIFISVFGLIAAALLTEAGASVSYTRVVAEHEEKVYAADAGVSLGIQQLQANFELCPETGSEETMELEVNGLPTEVTCKVSSGSTIGALGHALIATSPDSDSLTVQSGQTKIVTGPIHVTGGVNFLKELSVEKGKFSQTKGNGCTAAKPASLSLQEGYGYFCLDGGPTLPVYAAPAMPALARPSTTSGSCKIFYPGRYESVPALDVDRVNYFASGVYYFKFNNVLDISGTGTKTMVVYGGEPTPYEPVRYDATREPCARNAQAITAAGGSAPEVTGTGVEFILGSGARIEAGNKSQTELFTRTLDGTPSTSAPTIMAVQADWSSVDAGWVASAQNTQSLGFASGSDKAMLVHGLIFTPKQNVSLWSTNDVDAAVLGGVVAWKIDLQSAASGNGLTVSAVNGDPDPRHIVITATAPSPSTAGHGRSVVSTAVVQVANDLDGTVTINSWRTRAPNEAL